MIMIEQRDRQKQTDRDRTNELFVELGHLPVSKWDVENEGNTGIDKINIYIIQIFKQHTHTRARARAHVRTHTHIHINTNT